MRRTNRDNPFGKDRKVFVGVAGETPRKEFVFNKEDPVSGDIQKQLFQNPPIVEEETPAEIPPNALDFDRPKTSRGKPVPSPDEFFDYVIPSPTHDTSVSLLSFDNPQTSDEPVECRKDPSSFDFNVIKLGCWLFGSGLRV